MAKAEDLLARIRAARSALDDAGIAVERTLGDFAQVSLPKRDADALRDLLLADEAHVVIEVGLAYGSSALAIAEAIVSLGDAEARHVIIDPFQDQFGDAGWSVLKSLGLANVCSLEREKSQLALPSLVREGFVADAAFVDGSHIFHNVFVDLSFLRELVRPGGLVILDDCHWPSVATAARYFELNARWQPQPVLRESRLRPYRLPDPRFEPPFAAFTPFGLESHP